MNTRDFAQWENEICALEKSNAAAPQNAIAFAGSSTMALWLSLARDFSEFSVVNCGFGGSHIEDSTHFAPRILVPLRPRQIVFYAGENDIASGKSARRVFDDFLALRSVIAESLPRTVVTFLSIKPSPARWEWIEVIREANRLIQESIRPRFAGHPDFVDVFHPMLNSEGRPREELWTGDGVHMAREGYKLWAEIVRPHLTHE